MNKKGLLITVFALLVVVIGGAVTATDLQAKAWRSAPLQNYANREAACGLFAVVLLGKTESEVISLLGEPDSRGGGVCGLMVGEHEKLTYSLNNKYSQSRTCNVFVVTLKNGRVIKAQTQPWPT